jgi:hypothetical protein
MGTIIESFYQKTTGIGAVLLPAGRESVNSNMATTIVQNIVHNPDTFIN